MKGKRVFRIMLALLLTCMLTVAFNIHTVKSELPKARNVNPGPFVLTQDSPYETTSKPFSISAVDIINPQPGQFADYSHSFRYPNGTGWDGWWNMSYNDYVQPHVINTTHVVVRPVSPNGTFWCTVDTTSRWVTDTDPRFWWNQTWYVPWIETNVTQGSTINWWTHSAEIVGSKILKIAGKYIDCWVANSSRYNYSEFSYYDKKNGLLIMYQMWVEVAEGQTYSDMILMDTNIPVGWLKLSTSVYFNLNPNPVGVAEVLTLKGILIDTYSNSLGDQSVELYARALTGPWQYITSVTTNRYGIFTWQVTVPWSVAPGAYIFAVYYPGSEMYESSYNFAMLIIQ